jgi:hypothetical protein
MSPTGPSLRAPFFLPTCSVAPVQSCQPMFSIHNGAVGSPCLMGPTAGESPVFFLNHSYRHCGAIAVGLLFTAVSTIVGNGFHCRGRLAVYDAVPGSEHADNDLPVTT